MWEVFRPADQHSLVCILLTCYPNRPTTILKSRNMHLAWDLMQNPARHDHFTKRLMQSKNECGLWRNASPWDHVLTRQVTQKSRRRLTLSYIMPIKCEKVAGKCDGDSTLNHPICTFWCPTDSCRNASIPLDSTGFQRISLDSSGMEPESSGMEPESSGMSLDSTGLWQKGPV